MHITYLNMERNTKIGLGKTNKRDKSQDAKNMNMNAHMNIGFYIYIYI